MALSFGLSRAITARCASSTSSGLTSRARMSRASSRADFRVRPISVMRIAGLLSRPVDEAALDQQEEQVQPVAERAGGEDRRIHPRHLEQLLRLEHAVAEAVLRADVHLGEHAESQR